jgi:hypothetical protein
MTKHDMDNPQTQIQESQPPPEYQPPPSQSSQPPHQEEQQLQDPSNPPPYATATSTLPATTTTHNFTRRHLWTSKVQVSTSGVARYTFTPGPKNAVWLHAGASSSTKALGYLTFPGSHNAFRLYFKGTDKDGEAADDSGAAKSATKTEGIDAQGFILSDVHVRIGVPHVRTFTFKSSIAVSSKIREYEWSNKTPRDSLGPVRYVLSAFNAVGWEELAMLVVTSRKGKGKDGTSLRWRKAPESELEQAFLILSAIGVVTRLSRKGVFKEGQDGTAGQRWFALWWIAALSSAAMM